ncbi:hypothetical protein, partial [Melissospora conviva]|uniref:hypothetical protein n=1 Tax=Melissospora conviva TaxID=3388432 RepID=UPI003B817A42
FDEATAVAFVERFGVLVDGMSLNPDTPALELPIVTPEEHHRLVWDWNDTATTWPDRGGCLHELFEEQVARTPDAVALVCGGVR